jgi:hypothetical protein
MSGRRYKKPDDIVKARQEYLDNLSDTIDLQDKNEEIQKLYKETGQLPPVSQMKDRRTIEDKLRDFEKLKQSIINDMKVIADPQFTMNIIQRIIQSPLNVDNNLLVFFAQRATDIATNLKKIYKFGIKGDENDASQFVNFIYKFYNEKNTLVQNTKEFMNRMGANTSMSLSKKLQTQNTLLTSLQAEILALTNDTVQLANKVKTKVGPFPQNFINPAIKNIESLNKSILSLITNLNYIYPRDPIVLEKIEQLVISMTGKGQVNTNDVLYDAVTNYIKFINHSIPNVDFFGTLINELSLSNKTFSTICSTSYPTNQMKISAMDEELKKFGEILNSIYDQINTGEDLRILRQVREDYDLIIRYINEYGVQEFASIRATEKGEEPGKYPPPPYDTQGLPPPTITPDFGKKQRNYFLINEYPPSFPESDEGVRTYTETYIIPLLSIMPNSQTKNNYRLDVTMINNSRANPSEKVRDIVVMKKKILTYLKKHKISLDKLPEPDQEEFPSDSAMEPAMNPAGFADEPPIEQGYYSASRPFHIDRRNRRFGQGICGGALPLYQFTKSPVDPFQGTPQDPRYIKFGRYLVNTKRLKDNVLSLRREKGTPIHKLPAYKMSPYFSDVVNKIVGGRIPNDNDYKHLSDEELQYLHRVSKESDLDHRIKIPTPSKDQEERDIHKFTVLKGEIMAGNDSKEALKEFKSLLIKLSKRDLINKQDASDILETLNNLE